MSFVVAYLVQARELLVLPENWIQDLNCAKLKNNGRNSNQDFRAYYYVEGHENFHPPNFNAPLHNSLQDVRNEVCFMVRIKRFFGKEFKYIIYLKILNHISKLIW